MFKIINFKFELIRFHHFDLGFIIIANFNLKIFKNFGNFEPISIVSFVNCLILDMNLKTIIFI